MLVMFSFSVLLAAQEKKKDKDEETLPGMVKVEGAVHCSKPEPAYSMDVPDRSGHALMLGHRNCIWTEPIKILGAKTKTGVAVGFTERMEGTLHMHGFEVDTLDSGEKLTMRTMCQVTKDKGPVSIKGRWSFMRGTGKFKGIKGGGTFEGKLEADNGWTVELDGVYDPASLAGAKK
jgi:hypothetical protein